MLVLTV